ncbi:Uu.00g122820.m01.CDS01 [Anthostomella pinea]|uniref:Uu.00g122820.m01.CDS01 n=1 Tax=Anthostomella pinea TaxID=933095 RepID=A0AAI8YF14_9PEZI|nr:Uu.00g122820.m01.CDS01 [Anthostomella pinea]
MSGFRFWWQPKDREFQHFPRLPWELQDRIWEHAIKEESEQRIMIIASHVRRLMPSPWLVSSFLLVDRRSRGRALAKYPVVLEVFNSPVPKEAFNKDFSSSVDPSDIESKHDEFTRHTYKYGLPRGRVYLNLHSGICIYTPTPSYEWCRKVHQDFLPPGLIRGEEHSYRTKSTITTVLNLTSEIPHEHILDDVEPFVTNAHRQIDSAAIIRLTPDGPVHVPKLGMAIAWTSVPKFIHDARDYDADLFITEYVEEYQESEPASEYNCWPETEPDTEPDIEPDTEPDTELDTDTEHDIEPDNEHDTDNDTKKDIDEDDDNDAN